MRINPDNRADLLYSLNATQRAQDQALQQIASGRRVSVPSDDPAAMAALIQNNSQTLANDQFTQSLTSVSSLLQTADSTLGSVVSELQQAITLGVQGATGTLSQADRESMAAEASGIRDNLVTLANVSYNGAYVFSGTDTRTTPFVADLTAPAAVKYQGNSNTVAVPVGENRSMPVNVAGDQMFLSPNGNVFKSMNDLITALQNGDTAGISSAASDVGAAFDQVTSQRVFFGNALSQIQDNETFLSKEKLNLSDQENKLGGVDLAQSVSSLLSAQTARNATLAAAGQVSKLSLFDYLR